MSSDAILLFAVVPIFCSFLALLEKAFPFLKISKPVSVLSFFLGITLLGLFWQGIWEGNAYVTVVGEWPEGIGISQRLDGVSWVGIALTYLVFLPVLLYSFSEGGYDCRFYFFLLLLQGGMAGILLAADVFNLFVFLEISGIAAYTLIAYQQKDRAIFAGFKYLMLSSVGITLFLLGVFTLYRETGTLRYEGLAELATRAGLSREGVGIPTLGRLLDPDFLLVPVAFALATLLAGIGVRTAFLPYTWLPDAHGFAPHPISATLSGVVIKVSFIVVWKLVVLTKLWGAKEFLLWMGSTIALIGVLRALTQTDVKVLLAWHSVSQMGYVFAGFGAASEIAVVGSLYHMISHAFFKALLFLTVGTVILHTGERSLKKVSGVGGYFPFLYALFAVGALSIMGVPPFVGYVSKNLLFSGAEANPFSYALLFAASVGTVASFTKLSLLFRGTPTLNGVSLTGGEPLRGGKESAAEALRPFRLPFLWGYVGMTFLAILCVLGGVFGGYGMEFLAQILYGKEGAVTFQETIRNALPLASQTGLGAGNPASVGGMAGDGWSVSTAFLWLRGKEYLKTAVTLVLGYGVYRFITSKTGKRIQEWANRTRISFDNQLVLLLCGLLLLTGFIAGYYF